MSEKDKRYDSLPDEFATLEDAAAFWDTHDLGDYWDETTEVELEVTAPRRRWVVLASHLANQASERARQEGVSVETLVNLWIAERLVAEG
jgi:GNAT superfamily N-acetyltransferase